MVWLVTQITREVVEIVHVERVDAQKSTWASSAGQDIFLACQATPILILRFPDGDVEWRSTRSALPVGAKVRARGTLWRIREYADGGTATLEVFEVPGQGTPGSRTVNPTPIGDEPMTVEVLAAA